MAHRIIKYTDTYGNTIAKVYAAHQSKPEKMTIRVWTKSHIVLINKEGETYSYAVREQINDNSFEVRATLTNVY